MIESKNLQDFANLFLVTSFGKNDKMYLELSGVRYNRWKKHKSSPPIQLTRN